jgi:hypothetical protein
MWYMLSTLIWLKTKEEKEQKRKERKNMKGS